MSAAIIAHSPMKEEVGSFPHRIVIRDFGDKFVVHTEVHEPGKAPWYLAGDYYLYRAPDEGVDALRKAWRRFEYRTRKLLGIEESEYVAAPHDS